jgi:hypothetical protein
LKQTLVFEVSLPNYSGMVFPLENFVIVKLPKLPSCNESCFYEEFHIMYSACHGQPLCQWQTGAPGEFDGAPALPSKWAFKK